MISYYKNIIDNYIPNSIIANYKNKVIKSACLYTLQNGKRLRPIITISLINKSILDKNLNAYLDCALAIEFIHNASLIIDDLPCMDNDDLRRDEPTLHKYMNETIAQIAAMSLTTSAFKSLYTGMEKLSINMDTHKLLLKEVIDTISEDGIINGQFNDLLITKYNTQPNQKMLLKTIDKKTGILFELSFVIGYVLNNSSKSISIIDINYVRKCGRYFGRAYQIFDDICDMKTDKMNYAHFNTLPIAIKHFKKYLKKCKKMMARKGIWNGCIKEIYSYMCNGVKEKNH